jgi:hypothetical protein
MHVVQIAAEVCNDSRTAFRIAVALGKESVKAFPEKWKPKPILQVGDILLRKLYLCANGETDSYHSRTLDHHAGWAVVTSISNTGDQVSVQTIDCNVIEDKENSAVKIKPIMAISIYIRNYGNGRLKVKHFDNKQVIKNMTSLTAPLFMDTRWHGLRVTYETVDMKQFDNDGFITVPVQFM